jgi:uncharacterized protein (DUF2141 family)
MYKFLIGIIFLISIDVKAQCDLTIRIENVKKRSGKILTALCNDAGNFYTKAFQYQSVTVPASGDVIIVFKDLPKGKYAIRLFHDENNSEKLETGLFGIPKESYGFSNNPAKLGKPEFTDAAFQLTDNQTISIRLK